jgi:hypothetical protein
MRLSPPSGIMGVADSHKKVTGHFGPFPVRLPAFSAFERVGDSGFEPPTSSASKMCDTFPCLFQIYTIPANNGTYSGPREIEYKEML